MDIGLTKEGVIDFTGTDLVLTSSYTDTVAQRLTVRLKTHTGEWFLDLDYGVDWMGKVFGKNRSKASVDALLRIIIRQEKFVESITSFSSTLSTSRNYSAIFTVKAYGVAETTTLRLLLTNSGLSITTQDGNALLA